MLEAIENRISRRSFEKESLTKQEMQQINSYIKELNELSQLTMQFLEDGSNAFSSLSKSYGMFSNVKSLILMKGYTSDNHLKEKIGYYGEDLILRLTKLGLGTCWVGGTFDANKFDFKNNEKLICVIIVGKVKETTLKEKMIRAVISKNRKTIEQRLISDTNILPSWLLEGMEAVRLAPSAKNSQKPIFEYKQGIVSASVPNDYEFDLVDLGIAKKHFEIAANGLFKFGNGETFKLNTTT